MDTIIESVTLTAGDPLPVHPTRILHVETHTDTDFFDRLSERKITVWYYCESRIDD